MVAHLQAEAGQGSRRARGVLAVESIAPPLAGERGADRMAIFGRSGSGKSYLARNLLAVYGAGERHPIRFRGRLVIVDPNHNFDFPSNRIVHRPEDIEPTRKHGVVLYRPATRYQEDAESWNQVFRRLFLLDEPLMTYIDELTAVEPLFGVRRLEGGNYFTAYLTRGRALGKGAIITTQAPSSIPLNVIRQAEFFAAFDLPFEDDRSRVAAVMGRYSQAGEDVRDRRSLGRYEFWVRTPDILYPTRMKVV